MEVFFYINLVCSIAHTADLTDSQRDSCYRSSICAELLVYSRLDVAVGDSVELLCNTSLRSDIVWTYDTDDGYVDYVYQNGGIDSDKPRLLVNHTKNGFHSLVIRGAELNDSGLYDCYDGEGLRKAGYQLFVAGMSSSL